MGIFIVIFISVLILFSLLFVLYYTIKTTPYGPILFFAGIIRRVIQKNSKNPLWLDLEYRRKENDKTLQNIRYRKNARFENQITNVDRHGSVLYKLFQTDIPFDSIILFIHGGGFVLSSSELYLDFLESISPFGTIYSLDYPLAPENPYPVPVESTFAAYNKIRSLHPDKRIIVCGDSAGGNLAAGLVANCKKHRVPGPGGLVLIYPFLDLVKTDTPSYQKYSDHYALSKSEICWFRELYCPDPKLRVDPLVSPLYIEKPDYFPPTLLFSSGYDVLLDDATLMNQKLECNGVNVHYHCFTRLFHGFILLGKYLKEAQQLAALIGEWERKTFT